MLGRDLMGEVFFSRRIMRNGVPGLQTIDVPKPGVNVGWVPVPCPSFLGLPAPQTSTRLRLRHGTLAETFSLVHVLALKSRRRG